MVAASAPSRAGELLVGKYRLQELLAIGGMGEVYSAMNIAVDRPVAIKLLRKELTGNKAHVQRFIREGRASNKVSHPNIVPVLDIDRDGDQVFIVQDLLEGEDLDAILRAEGKKLSIEEALDVLIPVAEALGAAHAKGLVHRDLKPANVFMVREGARRVPKLLDFGIAKMSAQDAEGESLLTHTGMALGTPAYMSPEQIVSPRDVDARADVWALGVLLHRMISGRLPFHRDTTGGLMVAICTEPHRTLSDDLPGVPPAVMDVVERCLRKEPERRFSDGLAVARTLRALRDATGDEISGLHAKGLDHEGALPELEIELPVSQRPPASRPRSVEKKEPAQEARPAEAVPPSVHAPPPVVAAIPAVRAPAPAPVAPPGVSPELTQLAIASIPVTVAIAVGWSFDAHASIGGLRQNIGAAGSVIAAGVLGAASYQALHVSRQRQFNSLLVAAMGFGVLAAASLVSALVELGGDLATWGGRIAALTAVVTALAAAIFGLSRARVCFTSDPPDKTTGLAIGAAALVAAGAALRLLL